MSLSSYKTVPDLNHSPCFLFIGFSLLHYTQGLVSPISNRPGCWTELEHMYDMWIVALHCIYIPFHIISAPLILIFNSVVNSMKLLDIN